jgi:hypothetical protein
MLQFMVYLQTGITIHLHVTLILILTDHQHLTSVVPFPLFILVLRHNSLSTARVHPGCHNAPPASLFMPGAGGALIQTQPC